MRDSSTRRAVVRQILIGTALFLLAPAAAATENFPPAIKKQLELSYEPACAICHVDGITGKRTVNTRFGTTMRLRDLVAYDEASLIAALTAIDAEKYDSDGDGVTDIDELKAGSDPNVGAAGGEEDPSYGCTYAPSPAAPITASASLGLLLLVGALRRRAKVAPSRSLHG